MAELDILIPEEASLQETLKQVTDMLGHEKDITPLSLDDEASACAPFLG